MAMEESMIQVIDTLLEKDMQIDTIVVYEYFLQVAVAVHQEFYNTCAWLPRLILSVNHHTSL